MALFSLSPQDHVFWSLPQQEIVPLRTSIVTDVVIVGGGMAGITAAYSFAKKGLSVVLLEKNYCGAGATGKSSGFITPDSELSLSSLVDLYGANKAQQLWELVTRGVTHIKNTINNFALDCDYQEQDTLVVANNTAAFNSDIEKEYRMRNQLGYQATLYTAETLSAIIGSHSYAGGIRYGDSFGINGYRYCQGMKKTIQDNGVSVYEETPVLSFSNHRVQTPHATVSAEHIIVCVDQYGSRLPALHDILYHAQTFLLLSAPLSDAERRTIFPEKPLMVWDTDLIYTYYRLTGDNRLLLGGAHLWNTYAKNEIHNNQHIIKKLSNYFSQKFPKTSVQFEYLWPGLIGISKDLFPLAGYKKDMPSVYYITAAAGLPWAAALGLYSAERIIDHNTEFDDLFSLERSYTLGSFTQAILGKRLTFALSNFLTVGSI